MFKADVDAAFRRVPITPEHYWAAAVAFVFDGVVYVSFHRASPFGAIASVHSWERIGALLCNIARKVLLMAVYRYVYDFFGAEKPAVLQHAMECFARLIRLLLGSSSIAPRKLECGANLIVLGVHIESFHSGYRCRPAREKADKCLEVMHKVCEFSSCVTWCLRS